MFLDFLKYFLETLKLMMTQKEIYYIYLINYFTLLE